MYEPSEGAKRYAQNLIGSIDLTAIMLAYDAGRLEARFTANVVTLLKEIYHILATDVSAEDHTRMIRRLVDEWDED